MRSSRLERSFCALHEVDEGSQGPEWYPRRQGLTEFWRPTSSYHSGLRHRTSQFADGPASLKCRPGASQQRLKAGLPTEHSVPALGSTSQRGTEGVVPPSAN